MCLKKTFSKEFFINFSKKNMKFAIVYHTGCHEYKPQLVNISDNMKDARNYIFKNKLHSTDKSEFNKFNEKILKYHNDMEKEFKLENDGKVCQAYWDSKRRAMTEVNPSDDCYPLISFPKKWYITNEEQIYPRKRFRLSQTCHNEVFKNYLSQNYDTKMEIYLASLATHKLFDQTKSLLDVCHQPTIWCIPYKDCDFEAILKLIQAS